LEQYQGTVIFVSHDVYFIRRVGRKVLRISAGQLEWFAGDYDYYLEKSGAAAGRAGVVAGEKLPVVSEPGDYRPEEVGGAVEAGLGRTKIFKTREEKKEEARLRQERARQRREAEGNVRRLEEEIHRLEDRQKELAGRLEDPAAYEAGGKAMQWNRELVAVQEKLEELTVEWEAEAAKLTLSSRE
jgi:ATP-binding cassette subfamily F protein 3